MTGVSTLPDNTNNNWYSKGRYAFYANGRFWVFWSNGTDCKYNTSLDNSTWATAQTAFTTCSLAQDFDIHFDGTYFHYISTPSGGNAKYRRGLPNADGSISWSAVEQSPALTPAGATSTRPSIAVDSSRYPHVTWYRANSDTTKGIYTMKSTANDGTWGAPGGNGTNLLLGSDTGYYTVIIPLTATKMYAIASTANVLNGYLYNGTWGAAESISTNQYSGIHISATADGDNVHLVWCSNVHDTTLYDCLYSKRTYGVGWAASPTVIFTEASQYYLYQTICCDSDDSHDVYIFTQYSVPNYYFGYYQYRTIYGAWNSVVRVYTDSNAYYQPSSYPKPYSGTIAFVWDNQTGYAQRHYVVTDPRGIWYTGGMFKF